MEAVANPVMEIGAESLPERSECPEVRALNTMASEMARTEIPVLIVGESGTGKEVYARLVHRLSRYAGSPLRKIRCGSMETGKFGAGLAEALGKGEGGSCVFLDGIEELDLGAQRALLSLLPDGEWSEGDGQRVRVIASTSRNLEKEVEAGRFRRELYFRLSGACLRLPALRERKEDIPALTEYFLKKHAAEMKKSAPQISAESLELLQAHHWPGNIRELENLTRKMVALGETRGAMGDLQNSHLGPAQGGSKMASSSLKIAARAASRNRERELILEALQRTKWNRKRAAKELQISYKSLLYKIKQIEMPGTGQEE